MTFGVTQMTDREGVGLKTADYSMKLPRCLPPLSGAVLLVLAGCSQEADVKSQISELEKSFQGAGVAATATGGRPTADQAGNAAADARAYVNFALSAVQSNDYAGGVIALQAAQHAPGVTAAQLAAVENAKQAMTADLVARADRGDAKAKAQLAAIERTRSQ